MAERDSIQIYEATLNKLFKELRMKGVLPNFLRALLIASQERTRFEIAHTKLAEIFCPEETDDKKAKSRVRYAIKKLKEWQKKNKCTLVKVTPGRKAADEDGVVEYVKSRYELLLLKGVVEAFSCETEEERKTKIEDTLTKIKSEYKPPEAKKKYIPLKAVKAARKTIIGKIKAIYDLAPQIPNFEPRKYFKRVLAEARKQIDNLQLEYEQKKNMEAILREYDELANCLNSDS